MATTEKKITTYESHNYMRSYPVFHNNKYEDYLYKYLLKYYPEYKNDRDFIIEKAARAVQKTERFEYEDVSYFTVHTEALEMLYSGFGFSKFEIIDSILMDLYDDVFEDKGYESINQETNTVTTGIVTASEQRGIVAYTLQQNLQWVFDKYDIDNPEFEAESAYDDLRAELTEEIKKMVTKHNLLHDI